MSEEKNSEPKYSVVEMADYVSPKTVDEIGNKWVTWGVNNSYFKHLRELYLNSGTNNSCIKGITRLGYGTGLNFQGENEKKIFAKNFKKSDLRRGFLQFYAYNKMAFQIEYEMEGKKGVKRSKDQNIKRVHFIPAKNIAPAKKDEDGEILEYFYSENWSKRTTEKYRPKPVPAFGFGGDADEIEIYLFQIEQEEDDYFSPVLYQACLQYAECEVEQSNYHLNHLKNGFTTNAIINFNNGDPGPEERGRITGLFNDTKTGSANAGKPFITFNDGVENAVTLSSYDIPDPHKQYDFISKLAETRIYINHGITSPLLLGIRDSSGGLGSNANEIKEAYTLFKEMTLDPIREAFLDGLEPLLLKSGISEIPTMEDLSIFRKDEAEKEGEKKKPSNLKSVA